MRRVGRRRLGSLSQVGLSGIIGWSCGRRFVRGFRWGGGVRGGRLGGRLVRLGLAFGLGFLAAKLFGRWLWLVLLFVGRGGVWGIGLGGGLFWFL